MKRTLLFPGVLTVLLSSQPTATPLSTWAGPGATSGMTTCVLSRAQSTCCHATAVALCSGSIACVVSNEAACRRAVCAATGDGPDPIDPLFGQCLVATSGGGSGDSLVLGGSPPPLRFRASLRADRR